jgi:hypothetical protein
MRGAVSLAAVLLCGACERSSTSVGVDTSGFQLVVPSPSGEYAVCAKWAKGVPRWEIPQTFELRWESGVLWSQTLSAGLSAAAVTDEGTFLGCFAPGFAPETRQAAQLVLIDRAGIVLQKVDLSDARRPERAKLSSLGPFSLRPDKSEAWALKSFIYLSDGRRDRVMLFRWGADGERRETTLSMPKESGRIVCLNLLHVPGCEVVAVVCSQTIRSEESPAISWGELSVAFFDVESGHCLGSIPFATGVEQLEAERICQDLPGFWGIRSGLCLQVGGRDSDDEPVYAMIRVVEGEGGGRIETEYVGPRAESLAERRALPVVRGIPE